MNISPALLLLLLLFFHFFHFHFCRNAFPALGYLWIIHLENVLKYERSAAGVGEGEADEGPVQDDTLLYSLYTLKLKSRNELFYYAIVLTSF